MLKDKMARKSMTSLLPETGNLPAAFTTFVGRRRDIAEIQRLLGNARLLTLTGMGGVGKTRLAAEAASALCNAFPDGVWLVDLAPVQDPSMVADAAAAALRVPDASTEQALDRLTVHLARHRALLILDNCEHVADACAELAATLLSAAPELRILATSRQSLGIVGEHSFTVAPLPSHEAVDLLRDRATAVRREFRITDTNRDAVTRLCAGLDGLPLAIELAASRLRTLPVEHVADRLEERFELLIIGNGTASSRHRTLRAVIDYSYDLCTPAQQLLWNRLSVFAGTFALDAAEGVCAADSIAAHQVLDLLDQLVSQSVVLLTEYEGQHRFRLLETIRQYGRDRLADSGEEERVLRRHRDFYLALAERTAASWFGPGQEQALARLRAEQCNLLTALEYRFQPSYTVPQPESRLARTPAPADTQAALAMTAALRFHWCCNGFLSEGRRQFDRVLAAAPEPTPTRATALWAAAWVALHQGDLAMADQWLEEADQLGEQLQDPLVRSYAQGLRGTSALFRGQPQDALPLLEDTLAVQTSLGLGPGTLKWHFQLALAQTYVRDPRATQTCHDALAVAQTHGERLTRSYALWALGFGAWTQGRLEECVGLMKAALHIQQGFNDYAGVALALQVLAWSTAATDHHVRAAQLLGAMQSLSRQLSAGTCGAFPQYQAHCEKTLTKALGPAAYEKALVEGAGYDSPRRAVAFALSAGGDSQEPFPASIAGPLSPREQQVAALVAKGMSNRQIATSLALSPRTADRHVANILAKLGFQGRTQIALWWAANQPPTT